ncbi:MAG TPA: hypothetical protein VMU95_36340 [Trebonia sp.]|nr:hypothetical protein [Trebonia sp.]
MTQDITDAELAEQLQAGMAAYTSELTMPPHLPAAAGRAHRRRRARRGLAMSAGVLAAVAGLTIAVTSSPARDTVAPRPAPRAETLAYVLTQSQAAVLASASSVLEIREATGPGATTVAWARTGEHVFTVLAGDGQPAYSWSITSGHGSDHVVYVDYQARTWWAGTVKGPAIGPPGTLRIPLIGSIDQIHANLARGSLTQTGQQRLDGHDTLLIRAAVRQPGPAKNVLLWVDASSFLPVQVSVDRSGHGAVATTMLTWLPATTASLARFTLTPPSQFTRLAALPASIALLISSGGL